MNRKDYRIYISKIRKFRFSNDLKRYIFSKLFYFENYSYQRLINGLNKNNGINDKILKSLLPGNINDLLNYQMVINENFDAISILEISNHLIKRNENKINEFLNLKKEYENYLYRCQYQQAKDVLDTIDKNICISFWSVSQRFVIEENINGLEGNKKLLDDYLKKIKNKNLNSSMIDFMSVMAEKNTSLNNYQERLERFLSKIKNSNQRLYEYYNYKLNLKYEFNYSNVPIIMQIDSQFSLIDLYETYVYIQAFDTANEKKYLKNLLSIIYNVQDNRLNNICILNGLDSEVVLKENIEYYRICDDYTRGNYQKVICNIEEYHKKHNIDFQFLIMYVKSYVYSNQIFLSDNLILTALYNIYSLNDKYNESVVVLNSFLKQYAFLEWSIKLRSFIYRKTNIECDNNLLLISFLYDKVPSPSLARFIINQEQRQIFLNKMVKFCPVTTGLYRCFLSNEQIIDNNIEEKRKSIYNALICTKSDINMSNYLLENLNSEVSKKQMYYQEKITRMLFINYMNQNNINKCISISVNGYIKNPNFIKRLPINYVINLIENTSNNSYCKLIEYPIFMYICKGKDSKEVRYAYENFLESNNIEIVTDLLNHELFSRDLLCFFLFNICTIEVLKKDVNLHINGYNSVEVRIQILRFLSQINGNHRRIYENEISDITQKIEIDNRAEQINKSRIHVEVEKIFEEIKDWLSESYDMYLNIKNFDLSVSGIDINSDSLYEEISRYTQEINELIKNEPLVSQEYILFFDIVFRIAEEFLYNANFGLESFLSSRIRHGFLKDHLITVFNEHNLISKSDDDSSKIYMHNDYLSSKVKNDNDLQQLLTIFSDFTAKIEKKINQINSEWIRIKYKKDEVGLFDFSNFRQSVGVLPIDNITDYSVFFDSVIEILWSHLDDSLKMIKNKIDCELKVFFDNELISLENNIKQFESEYPLVVSEINQKINLCKSKLSETISTFKEVFSVETNKYKDYTLNDLISTAKQINKKLFARFDEIKFSQYVEYNQSLDGAYFPFLVDILCIMINNAITHSSLDVNKLEIQINMFSPSNEDKAELMKEYHEKWKNIEAEEDLLVIQVKNNMNCTDLEKLKLAIESTFDNLNKPEVVKKYAQKEGGSGLYKIYQRLKFNIPSPYIIMYQIDQESFEIEIVIGLLNIISKEVR